MGILQRTGLFNHFYTTKFWTLGLLFISLIGARGKKEEKLNYKIGMGYIFIGLSIYFTAQYGWLAQFIFKINPNTFRVPGLS